MASAIYFGGSRINIPGAYTVIDASELAEQGPGAVGVVAILGTSEGGVPLSAESSDVDCTRPEKVRERFRSGDLLTAGLFAFEPSTDDAIPGGASRVVPIKVNPATQSGTTLLDGVGADAVDVTSVDYGLFTDQINLLIETGSVQGKKVTITLEDDVEELDNLGGDSALNIAYDDTGDTYDTVTARFTSTQFLTTGTKAEAGLATQITAVAPAGLPSTLEIVSANAGDTTQEATVYGIAGGVATRETVTLTGTTPVVTTTATWTKVLAIVLSAVTTGNVTVEDDSSNTIATITAGSTTAGAVVCVNMPSDGVLTVSIDSDTAIDVAVFGTNAAGGNIGEVFDMTAGNTTPVVGSVDFDGSIGLLALGEAAAARTITVEATPMVTSHSVYNTLSKLADYISGKDGFSATALKTDSAAFSPASMDYEAAASVAAAGTDFYANLNAVIVGINNGSGIVTAARASGASLVPTNTASAVYLTGGGEGTTTITQWQEAFTALKKRRVNIICVMSDDAAVHALLAQHLRLRAGKLRSEANGYVGIGTGDSVETKANIKSQIQILGTRHLSAFAQEVERYDPLTGEATWFPPYIGTAVLAGMQAGSPIGEPLTYKRPFVLNFRQDSSWSPEDDKEELIDAGLLLLENKEGEGIRVTRSVTTYLKDNNLAYTEMSANESLDQAVYRFRTELERKIGSRGLVGTASAILGLANATLAELVDEEIIFAYRSLSVEQVGDVFPVSVQMAPIVPVNFIPATVHVFVPRAAAA